MQEREKGVKSKIGRRQFLSYMGVGGIGTLVASKLSVSTVRANDSSRAGYKEIMKEVMKYRKIDTHAHISKGFDLAKFIDSADRLGIEKLAISIPLNKWGDVKPHEFRESNDLVIRAMKQYPDRILGQCFINPRYKNESLKEIDRCLDAGMVQLGELYTQVKINDPLYYPIIERCIELKIPLMMHDAEQQRVLRKGCDLYTPLTTSISEDFADIGRRYPEAMIIHAHIGGGGDWEHKCKAIRDVPSVYIDTSGSVHDEGMIDFALKCLGEDRMLFATDMNFETGVGKILAANLNERQRKKIFFDNFNNLLRKAGNNVN